MEPKNDNTWLLIGGAAGCGLVLLLLVCGAGAAFFVFAARDQPAPMSPVTTPMPMPMPPPMPLPPPPSIPPSMPPLVPGSSGSTDTAPRLVRATVTRVTGASVASVGQTCEFNVERRDLDDGAFWCNAQIVCGGHLLFGGPSAGFFPCTLYDGPPRHVVGSDPETTIENQDPAMTLTTVDGTLEIWDDASGPNGEFRLTAHVDSVE